MTAPIRKKKNRSKLGRGLSALVDQSASSPIRVVAEAGSVQITNILGAGERVLEIDVTRVVPNPHQPRRHFEEESLEELAQSIREHGLMQPIVVRMAQGEDGDLYELIAGERRWRATCRTGQASIRAIVRDINDLQSAQLALIENIQREDLNAIERAHGFSLLVERFSMTQGEVATKVGISRSSVANFLRLIELDDEIQTMIASGLLGSGHGKVLLSCKDLSQRLSLARQAVSEEWTVRVLEGVIAVNSVHNDPEILESDEDHDEKRGNQPTRVESVVFDIEKRLGEHLGTNVKLKTDRSGTKGSITIEFYDLDHFDGLMNRFGVVADDELLEG